MKHSQQGGYDSIYIGLIAKLSECDFQEAADRLGLDYVDGKIHVSFLTREYRITVDKVEPLDGRPVDVNIRSVLLLSHLKGKIIPLAGCFLR